MKRHKIIIEYLYCDAANYKIFKEAIIENPYNLSLHDFDKWFRNLLIDGLWFIPNDFGLVKPQFPNYNPELDHYWCKLILLKEEDV